MTCFHSFEQPINDIAPPQAFTFPFFYQPHSLAKIAATQLQQHLTPLSNQQGRMYGVLVVKNEQGNLGFITACSGTQTDMTTIGNKQNLVPAVFTGFEQNSYYLTKQSLVNQLTHEIKRHAETTRYRLAKTLVTSEQSSATFQISQLQRELASNRQIRKALRAEIAPKLTDTFAQDDPEIFERAKQQSIQLSRESVQDKKQLAALKTYWQQRIEQAQQAFLALDSQLSELKKSRRKLSNKLQKLLFKQYQFLNIKGETKDLNTIFENEAVAQPPAGSGDCAAPKLLQYAFNHKLTPVCMAEFWWGLPAKSEIRKHGHFYPACQGKCLPILTHMLDGMKVDDNPLLENPADSLDLPIIYQDDDLVVVNKPANMLSVPGKNIEDSVYTRIKKAFPHATGSLVLHRLDMATSGLLLLSLNEKAHKHLQKQFINKEINKRYVAVIDGTPKQTSGEIHLPLLLDIHDRPKQKVCFKYGKRAETQWQMISTTKGQSTLYLYPITGRTHQLRMHCAHPDGLNMPIIGDTLYGTPANRLHLHAESLSFIHPSTKERMSFTIEADFI